jgi:hypothetical protein
MPRGGKREGSGAKPKDPAGLAKMTSFRLGPTLIEQIKAGAAARGVSQAEYLALAVESLEGQPPGS